MDGKPLSAFAADNDSHISMGSRFATPRSRLAVPDFTSVVPGAAVGRDRYARRRETLRAAFEAGLH